ncbi:hypothetical protein J3F83DRAFT_486260 [Trichoderma novae-zelandiae]
MFCLFGPTAHHNNTRVSMEKCLFELKQRSGRSRYVKVKVKGAEGPAREIKSDVEAQARFFLPSTLQHFDCYAFDRPIDASGLSVVTCAAPLDQSALLFSLLLKSVDRPSFFSCPTTKYRSASSVSII